MIITMIMFIMTMITTIMTKITTAFSVIIIVKFKIIKTIIFTANWEFIIITELKPVFHYETIIKQHWFKDFEWPFLDD
jgi:hypothetical protein